MAGVPAELLFQGRFASKTTAQLTLLNTTVAQLAKSINSVLTMAYREIYGDEDDGEEPAQVQLLTSPLSATEEVVALFAAGLAPLDIAMSTVLHAIGSSKDEIDRALENASADAKKACQCADEDRAFQQEDQKLRLEERRAGLAAAPAKANVAQTEATAKKTLEEAAAAGKPSPKPAEGGLSESNE